MALKVGVVGMSGIGNQHADCHSKDSLADLVAVCDVVKEKADAAAEKHGVKAYYSLKDMLTNEELDVVDVTTGGYENGSWHFDPAMEALDAGRHVLFFKGRRNGFMPEYVDHPVKDMRTWQENVKWRLDPTTPARFVDWDKRMAEAVEAAPAETNRAQQAASAARRTVEEDMTSLSLRRPDACDWHH